LRKFFEKAGGKKEAGGISINKEYPGSSFIWREEPGK